MLRCFLSLKRDENELKKDVDFLKETCYYLKVAVRNDATKNVP